MSVEIKVADQMGTFVDYRKPLQASAPAYADPVNRRVEYLPDPEEFRKLAEKLGRNDLCLCGSGKRFKRCYLKSGRSRS